MTRRVGSKRSEAEAPRRNANLVEPLLGLRDGLAEAKCLTAVAWLACGSPLLDRTTAAALAAVINAVRTRLEDLLTDLDALVTTLSVRDE